MLEGYLLNLLQQLGCVSQNCAEEWTAHPAEKDQHHKIPKEISLHFAPRSRKALINAKTGSENTGAAIGQNTTRKIGANTTLKIGANTTHKIGVNTTHKIGGNHQRLHLQPHCTELGIALNDTHALTAHSNMEALSAIQCLCRPLASTALPIHMTTDIPTGFFSVGDWTAQFTRRVIRDSKLRWHSGLHKI